MRFFFFSLFFFGEIVLKAVALIVDDCASRLAHAIWHLSRHNKIYTRHNACVIVSISIGWFWNAHHKHIECLVNTDKILRIPWHRIDDGQMFRDFCTLISSNKHTSRSHTYTNLIDFNGLVNIHTILILLAVLLDLLSNIFLQHISIASERVIHRFSFTK